MTSLEALLLGIVQGLLEFFPVSSSSHLNIIKSLMGISSSETEVLFDVFCHSGTLLAALYFFRNDIRILFFERRDKLLQIFLALLPLIPAYFLLHPLRELHSFFLNGCTMLITALLLFTGQSYRIKRQANISRKRRSQDALCIGLMQSCALIPGISRSASTISCARVLGWNIQEAVRFSFLLAIPTILGGNCLVLLKCALHTTPTSWNFLTLLIGLSSSFLASLAVIGPAIRFLEKGKFQPFGWYCLLLGIALMLFSI